MQPLPHTKQLLPHDLPHTDAITALQFASQYCLTICLTPMQLLPHNLPHTDEQQQQSWRGRS